MRVFVVLGGLALALNLYGCGEGNEASSDLSDLEENGADVGGGDSGNANDNGTDGGENNNGNQNDDRTVPGQCENGRFDPQETGVDCGGLCPPCTEQGQRCNTDLDCADGLLCGLDDGLCDLAGCEDGVRNGLETDVDCGGSGCATRCAPGELCAEDDGLGNPVFADENCREPDGGQTVCDPLDSRCDEPACDDALVNQGEPSADCGGPCLTPCEIGEACFVDKDCPPATVEIAEDGIDDEFVAVPALTQTFPPGQGFTEEVTRYLARRCAESRAYPCAQETAIRYRFTDVECDEDGETCEQTVVVGEHSCARVPDPLGCVDTIAADPTLLEFYETESCATRYDCYPKQLRMVFSPAAGDFVCNASDRCELAVGPDVRELRAVEQDCSADADPPAPVTRFGTCDYDLASCSYGSRSRQEQQCSAQDKTNYAWVSLADELCTNETVSSTLGVNVDGTSCIPADRRCRLNLQKRKCEGRAGCRCEKGMYTQQLMTYRCAGGGCSEETGTWESGRTRCYVHNSGQGCNGDSSPQTKGCGAVSNCSNF